MTTAAPLLAIRNLRTTFPTDAGVIRAVDGVDLVVELGECLGVVGESGSGKSITFTSVMGLIRKPGRIVAGEILFNGRDLTKLSASELRKVRGREIALTLQDALTALNPVLTIGDQIREALPGMSRSAARLRALELLRLVGIGDPERRLKQYPHELSGGTRQRVMIAIALALGPKLLIADEPTSALDVTVQAQVLDLLVRLRRDLGLSVVLISHDLSVVAERCDRVAVMYAGQVVEVGPAWQVITAPLHPYTKGLIDALPQVDDLDRPIRAIAGQAPDPRESIAGCRFRPRCTRAIEACATDIAMRTDSHSAREVRCVRPLGGEVV